MKFMTEEERRKEEQLAQDFEDHHMKRLQMELYDRCTMKVSSFLEDCNHEKQRLEKEALDEKRKLRAGEILINLKRIQNI